LAAAVGAAAAQGAAAAAKIFPNASDVGRAATSARKLATKDGEAAKRRRTMPAQTAMLIVLPPLTQPAAALQPAILPPATQPAAAPKTPAPPKAPAVPKAPVVPKAPAAPVAQQTPPPPPGSPPPPQAQAPPLAAPLALAVPQPQSVPKPLPVPVLPAPVLAAPAPQSAPPVQSVPQPLPFPPKSLPVALIPGPMALIPGPLPLQAPAQLSVHSGPQAPACAQFQPVQPRPPSQVGLRQYAPPVAAVAPPAAAPLASPLASAGPLVQPAKRKRKSDTPSGPWPPPGPQPQKSGDDALTKFGRDVSRRVLAGSQTGEAFSTSETGGEALALRQALNGFPSQLAALGKHLSELERIRDGARARCEDAARRQDGLEARRVAEAHLIDTKGAAARRLLSQLRAEDDADGSLRKDLEAECGLMMQCRQQHDASWAAHGGAETTRALRAQFDAVVVDVDAAERCLAEGRAHAEHVADYLVAARAARRRAALTAEAAAAAPAAAMA